MYFSMQTKRSRLNIRQGREINGRRISSISLERVEYFEDARAHPLVVCTGLGGSARLDPLIEELAKDFHVTSWSSRGAGASIGNLTLGDHIMDLKYVIDTVNNESDERPYVYAHGFGAHALAKVLTLRDIAKKAVLAAPLIHPLEQNPAILNWYLKHTQEKQVLGGLFSLAAYVSRKLFLTRQSRDATWLAIDRQWFTEDSVLPFLDSIIDVEPVTGYFQSPTRVLLPVKVILDLS